MYTWFEPISHILSYGLSMLYHFTHDWGAAIILLTLAVRLLLVWFSFSAARQMLRSAAAQPEMSRIREAHGSDPARLLQEMGRVNRAYGVRPFAVFGSSLLQMPVLMAMYGLFLTHGASMTTLLLPWMAQLALADPLHLVPLATGLLSFAVGLLPLAEVPGAAMPAGKRTLLALALMLVPLFITWAAPAALGLYWMAGSLFALGERLFYRTAAGLRLLRRGMPGPQTDSAA